MLHRVNFRGRPARAAHYRDAVAHLALANLPPAVAEKLDAQIVKALKSPDPHEKLMGMRREPRRIDLKQSDAHVKREIGR